MTPPRAIFALKIYQNEFVAGASLRTPLGAYSAPQTPSWFSAGCFAAEEERRQGKEREGKDERDGDGNRRTEIVK